jgi:hypothetical protein
MMRDIGFAREFHPLIEARLKTVTRRLVTFPAGFSTALDGLERVYSGDLVEFYRIGQGGRIAALRCPYGGAGTLLQVRESTMKILNRGFSIERLQEITDKQARDEGFMGGFGSSARDRFFTKWDSIYTGNPVASNPWVWAVKFELEGSH